MESKAKTDSDSRLQENSVAQVRLAEEANKIAKATQERLLAESQRMENKIKRANDVMREVLYPFPSDPSKSLPMYFNSIDKLFEIHQIEEGLRILLLNPMLPEKA